MHIRNTTKPLTRRMLLRGFAAASPVLYLNRAAVAQSAKPPALAQALAQLFHAVKFSNLSPTAVKHGKMILASTLASAAAGTKMESAKIIKGLAKENGGAPQASIWFDGTKLPLTETVRVNAMLSDAAASDDSDLRNVAHTGTSLTAICLAIAERTGASGEDVLTAIATGYEAAGRFGDMVRGGRPGLHASLIVAFGATVAAARLLGLTPQQMAHALSITAASVGGILIGTVSWAREYMGGNAAHTAMNSALAAQHSFTANDDLLEAKGGFLDTFGNGKRDSAQLTREIGPQWDIEKYLAIKLLPGAHALHPSLEAAINSAKQGNVNPDDVIKIIQSGPPKTSITYAPSVPKDMVEAIHSLPYFLATGVADRDFNWSHITPEKMHRPVIARLVNLVEYEAVPASAHYDWNWGGTVTIVTKQGARFTSTVDAVKGSGPRGIEWSDVEAKYHALMQDGALPAKRNSEMMTAIHDFEKMKQASQLTRMLH